MNEHCRIGLHSFDDWQEKAGIETRVCRVCRHTEQRTSQPEPKPPRDPYADL